MRRVLFLLFVVTACNRPLWNPPGPQPKDLSPRDRRVALVGRWEVMFSGDTVARQRVTNPRTVRGVLVLSDTIIENGAEGLKGSADFDFEPMLGRQVSCFNPGRNVFPISWHNDSVFIHLTPNAADCGLVVVGRLARDTVRGRWSEPSFVGHESGGV